MKKYILSFMIFCLIILLSFGVSISPVNIQTNLFAFAQENEVIKDGPPLDLAELRNASDEQLDRWATTLSSFDGRTYDYITPARHQYDRNTCWAYAAVGAVEANILRNGIDDDVTKATLDLDETIVAYTRHSRDGSQDPLLLTTDDTYYYGRWNQGDSAVNAFAIMTQGYALVKENGFHTSVSDEDLKSKLKQSKYYVKNYQHISSTKDAIKRAILKYGAVTFNYSGPSSYLYYDPSAWANHTSIIVGWDDNVSKDDFSPSQPSGDGAWIIKNSWGNQNGYNTVNGTYCYYISYELPIGSIEAVEMAMTEDYQNIYHYDGDIAISLNKKAGEAQAVIYEAKLSSPTKQEQLKAVEISVPEDNLDVNIKIYKNLNVNPGNVNDRINIPEQGRPALEINTQLNNSGMHTIDLTNLISLEQGEYFSIVVRCKRKSGVLVAVNCAVDNRSINDMTYYLQDNRWTNFKNSNFYADSGTDKRVAKIRAITNTVERETGLVNDLQYARVEIENRLVYYAKDKVLVPELNVYLDNNLLEYGQDYIVEVQNIVAPGKTEIKVLGIGKYQGARITYFEVAKAKDPPGRIIDTVVVDKDITTLRDIPTPTDWKWVDENKRLENGTNLVSMIYVEEDKNFYQNLTYDIYVSKLNQDPVAKIDISTAEIEIIGDYIYTGEAIVPSIKVVCNNIELRSGKDYTITLQDNIYAGTATVIAKGMGRYFGQICQTFTISKAEKPNIDTKIRTNKKSVKLSDIQLPSGFVWENEDLEFIGNTISAKAIYMGEDASSYEITELTFEIIFEEPKRQESLVWLGFAITVVALMLVLEGFMIVRQRQKQR